MDDGRNIEDTIKDLNGRVSQFADSGDVAGPGILSSIRFSPYMYYGLIPVAIMAILFLFKPGFVMETDSVDGKYPEPRVGFRKFLLATMVLSVMAGLGIFMYFYRKR